MQIQPGATTVVQIGGTGAILSGRLVLSKPGQAIDWSKRLVMPMLQTKLPYPPGLNGRARAEWYRQVLEIRRRTRPHSRYMHLSIGRAGRRRVYRGGVFRPAITNSAANSPMPRRTVSGVLGHIIGSFKQDVTVPQPADGQSTGKIDLGAVTVQSQGH